MPTTRGPRANVNLYGHRIGQCVGGTVVHGDNRAPGNRSEPRKNRLKERT
jgi:hypothetical protein